jgi:large subunit ribosomal protein L29
VKVNEFRELEEDQLGDRLRAARRELYELRFKHAVGQLENSSQIAKVRHDIARIMTVITERELGLVTHIPAQETAAVAVAEKDEGFEPEAEATQAPVATATVDASDAPKPKRVRKAKVEEKS